MKIGQHEFEAEGDADTIKQQFEEFKALMPWRNTSEGSGGGNIVALELKNP